MPGNNDWPNYALYLCMVSQCISVEKIIVRDLCLVISNCSYINAHKGDSKLKASTYRPTTRKLTYCILCQYSNVRNWLYNFSYSKTISYRRRGKTFWKLTPRPRSNIYKYSDIIYLKNVVFKVITVVRKKDWNSKSFIRWQFCSQSAFMSCLLLFSIKVTLTTRTQLCRIFLGMHAYVYM